MEAAAGEDTPKRGTQQPLEGAAARLVESKGPGKRLESRQRRARLHQPRFSRGTKLMNVWMLKVVHPAESWEARQWPTA